MNTERTKSRHTIIKMAKDKEREDSKGNRRKTDSVIKNKTNKQQQKKKTP